jgi:hypothetical protein
LTDHINFIHKRIRCHQCQACAKNFGREQSLKT